MASTTPDLGRNMATKKIIVTDRFSSESLLLLERQPEVEVIKLDPQNLLTSEHLASADGLLIRSRTQIDISVLEKAKNLQLIITATSGFDHIDLEATQKWGITVMHTPNANRESAAQLTMALLLNCAQKISEAGRSVKAGHWRQESLLGFEINQRTWGLVGLGRIGSRVCELAQAFRMNVIAYDPYLSDEEFDRLKAKRVSFEELLKLADVISFHVPKTPETTKMLTKSQFEYINRDAILINTSRGTVIDEESLIWALEKKLIKGLALDVYEKEPLSRNSKLLQFPEVLLTPHIGAFTEDAFYKASHEAILKLIQFFIDGSTKDTLPPQVPWYGASHFKFD